MTPAERRHVPGIKPERGDVILGGAVVVQSVMELGGFDELEATDAGLREGVFFSVLLEDRDPPLFEDVRRASVINLAAQYHADTAHTEHVAALALHLWDEMAAAGAHPGAREERELLWAAAMLHDIGTAVDYDDHHKHSRYLILSAGLPGFDPRETGLIGQMARYHRKGQPTLGEFEPLARRGDDALLDRCAACLRVAEQLERPRDQSVRRVHVSQSNGRVELRLESDVDVSVARWAAQRESDLFARAFGREPSSSRSRAGPPARVSRPRRRPAVRRSRPRARDAARGLLLAHRRAGGRPGRGRAVRRVPRARAGAWALVTLAAHPGRFARSAIEAPVAPDPAGFGVRAGRRAARRPRPRRGRPRPGGAAGRDAGRCGAVPAGRVRRARAGARWCPASRSTGTRSCWRPACAGRRASAGRPSRLDGAVAYAEKNWGRAFPGRWWWGHAGRSPARRSRSPSPAGRSGSRAPGSRRPRWWSGSGDEVLASRRRRAAAAWRVGGGAWRVAARGPGVAVDLEGDAAGAEPHVLEVPVPGERRTDPRSRQHLAAGSP